MTTNPEDVYEKRIHLAQRIQQDLMDIVDSIAEVHSRDTTRGRTSWECQECGKPFPCKTRILATGKVGP